MFGQYPNFIASAAKWMFLGFVGIIVMALLLGANIKDATWLNPKIAAAQADRINVETAHQQATFELQERLANAQTKAEIREIQREQNLLDAQYQHDIQLLTQDLEHREISFRTWMNVLIILAGTIAGVLLILATAKGYIMLRADVVRNRAARTVEVDKVSQPSPDGMWKVPAYRYYMKKIARENEQKGRAAMQSRRSDSIFKGTRRIWPESNPQEPPSSLTRTD